MVKHNDKKIRPFSQARATARNPYAAQYFSAPEAKLHDRPEDVYELGVVNARAMAVFPYPLMPSGITSLRLWDVSGVFNQEPQ